MPLIQIKSFGGEIPKLPTHLIPDTNAQVAVNCDFAHGDLRPLRGGFKINTMRGLVQSIFTQDGLTYYTWSRKVYAVKGPVINDTFRRMYYTDSGTLRVASMDGMDLNGGEPSFSYGVGVLPPVRVTATKTLGEEIANFGEPSVAVTTWFEAGGMRYQQQVVNVTPITKLRTYGFPIPQVDTVPEAVTKRIAELNQKNAPQVTNFFARNIEQLTDVVGLSDEEKAELDSLNSLVKDFTPNSISTYALVEVAIGETRATFTLREGGSQFFDGVPGGFEVKFIRTTPTEGKIEFEYGTVGTYVFAVTQTNTYLEEGGPAISGLVDVTIADKVTLEITIDRNPDLAPLQRLTVYQSTTSGRGYLGVKEVPVPSGNTVLVEFNPAQGADPALGTLDTTEYLPPPAGLDNLVVLPNGFLAASKGNDVYFSEAFRPHAWPNSMTFPHQVTGLVVAEQQLLVLTTAVPYLVIGTNPANLGQQRLPDTQAGFSSRAAAYSNGLLIYASRDGLVAVQGASSTLEYSQAYFTREDWRNRYNGIFDSLSMSSHDGFLVGMNPLQNNGFVFRLDEGRGSYTQFAETADAVFPLPLTDSVYYSKGRDIFEFQGGSPLELRWRSKDFVMPRHVNMGAAYIRSDGSVRVIVYCSDPESEEMVVHSDQTIIGTKHFRLESGRRSLRWSVELITSSRVYEFAMAQTMRELQGG